MHSGSVRGRSLSPAESERTWLFRRPLTVGAIIVLAGLAALGYATPPDPSWIPGLYDLSDGDDLVGMLTDESGATDGRTDLPSGECDPGQIIRVVGPGRVSGPVPDSLTIRGPPIGPRDPAVRLRLAFFCRDFLRTTPRTSIEYGLPAPSDTPPRPSSPTTWDGSGPSVPHWQYRAPIVTNCCVVEQVSLPQSPNLLNLPTYWPPTARRASRGA